MNGSLFVDILGYLVVPQFSICFVLYVSHPFMVLLYRQSQGRVWIYSARCSVDT